MSGPVLLTGATGLIGSWVVRHWPASGPVLVPLGSADVNLLRPGAAARILEREEPSDVIHLAWSASGHPDYRNSDDNARWLAATLELTEAAAKRGTGLWLTGTVVDDIEGNGADRDPYTLTKSRLRHAVATYVESGAIGWVRPFYVVDEMWRRPSLVAEALEAAHAGRPVALRSPEAVHDFVHASDVGAAVVCAAIHGIKGYLPIGSGRLRRVCDLVVALGARWEPAGAGRQPTHAEVAADTRWLTARGWTPTRTQELFADD